MTCYVYVLGCTELGKAVTYVGWTTELERRLEQHNAGSGARTTRGRNWVLIYAEKHDSQISAMSREWHLKRDRTFRKMLRENGT